MRRSLLLAVLLAGPAASAPKLKDKVPTAPYWPTSVGAAITYQWDGETGTRTRTVTAVERAAGVTKVASDEVGPDGRAAPANKVEVRADGLFLTEEFGHPYDPPVCLLKFPVTKGAKWTTVTKRADIGPVEFTREVGETKTIETPGGRFEAVRVSGDMILARGTQTKVYWFAPEVGIIKIEGVRTLTKYTPGK
jgi:hypothetical protein